MSMLYLKVVDEKGKVINLKDLTSLGLETVRHDCDDMIEKVDELLSKRR